MAPAHGLEPSHAAATPIADLAKKSLRFMDAPLKKVIHLRLIPLEPSSKNSPTPLPPYAVKLTTFEGCVQQATWQHKQRG
jgi:hypothetical protein